MNTSASPISPASKTFRYRKLEFSKPIPIYIESDLLAQLEAPSVSDFFNQLKSISTPITTGVDKEEEEETHLKRILEKDKYETYSIDPGYSPSPMTFANTKKANFVIPIPEANEISLLDYEELYPPIWKDRALLESSSRQHYVKAPPPPPRFLPFSFLMGESALSNDQSLQMHFSFQSLHGFKFGAKMPLSMLMQYGSRPLFENNTINTNSAYLPYCITEHDVNWLSSFNKENQCSCKPEFLEAVLWIFECVSYFQGPEMIVEAKTLQALESHLQPYYEMYLSTEDVIVLLKHQKNLFDYWKQKREHIQGLLFKKSDTTSISVPLIPTLKLDDHLSSEGPNALTIDPYVCFRKREARTSRRTRRADLLAYEKLLKLLGQLDEIVGLSEMMTKRDRVRIENLDVEILLLKPTFRLEEWSVKFPTLQSSIKKHLLASVINLKRKEIPEAIAGSEFDSETDLQDVKRKYRLKARIMPVNPHLRAALFSSIRSYKDLRRIYHKSNAAARKSEWTMPNVLATVEITKNYSQLLDPEVDYIEQLKNHIPAFSSISRWARTDFHPISACMFLEKCLDLKNNTMASFDYVKSLREPEPHRYPFVLGRHLKPCVNPMYETRNQPELKRNIFPYSQVQLPLTMDLEPYPRSLTDGNCLIGNWDWMSTFANQPTDGISQSDTFLKKRKSEGMPGSVKKQKSEPSHIESTVDHPLRHSPPQITFTVKSTS